MKYIEINLHQMQATPSQNTQPNPHIPYQNAGTFNLHQKKNEKKYRIEWWSRTAVTDQQKLNEIIVIGSSSGGWSSHLYASVFLKFTISSKQTLETTKKSIGRHQFQKNSDYETQNQTRKFQIRKAHIEREELKMNTRSQGTRGKRDLINGKRGKRGGKRAWERVVIVEFLSNYNFFNKIN